MLNFQHAFVKSKVNSDIFIFGSNVIDASPLRGGHPAGQIGQVYGIVEFKDGVRRVDPVSIKFCDEENAHLCALVKHNEALRKGEVNAES